MKSRTRLFFGLVAMCTVAGLTAGTLVLTGEATADEAAATEQVALDRAAEAVLDSSSDEAVSYGLFKKKKYKAKKPVWNVETQKWKATVKNTETGETTAWGSYDSADEASDAADDYVDRNNGVVDGPGCNPPLVLC